MPIAANIMDFLLFPSDESHTEEASNAKSSTLFNFRCSLLYSLPVPSFLSFATNTTDFLLYIPMNLIQRMPVFPPSTFLLLWTFDLQPNPSLQTTTMAHPYRKKVTPSSP